MSLSKFVLTRRISMPLVQILRTQSTVPLKQTIDGSTESNVRPFDDIPGPKGLPYIGSVHRYVMGGGLQKMHKVHQKMFNEFGPIFKERLFGQIMVHLLDPDDAATVFRSAGKYPRRLGSVSLAHLCNEKGIKSISARDGPEWKRLRTAVSSKMMKPKELYDNIDNFNAVADDALESIRRVRGRGKTEGEPESLGDELAKWATESIGTLVFDARMGIYEDPPIVDTMEFIKAIHNLFVCMHNLEHGAEKMFYKKFDTPSKKKMSETFDFIRGFALKYVDAKMDELKDDLKNPEKLLDGQAVSLLTFLLAKGDLSTQEIVDSSIDIFLGGVDTTSITLTWGLYRLATNPDVQERLYQEIVSVIGKDGYLTARDLGRIPYLKAFLKELFRLDTIALMNTRILDQDVVLSGYAVPAGTPVFPNIYSTSRSETYFKDAEQFKPERWLRETMEKTLPFSSLPFGFGSRMCIGKRTAELEIILFLSKLVQQFRLEYHHKPLEKILTLFLQPEEKNIKIDFIDRD